MSKIRHITIGTQRYIEHAGFVRYQLVPSAGSHHVDVIIEIGYRSGANQFQNGSVKLAQRLSLPLRSTRHLQQLLQVLHSPGGNWRGVTYLFTEGRMLAGILMPDQQVLWLDKSDYTVAEPRT